MSTGIGMRHQTKDWLNKYSNPIENRFFIEVGDGAWVLRDRESYRWCDFMMTHICLSTLEKACDAMNKAFPN